MAQVLHFKKISNEILAPATPEAVAYLSKIKNDTWLSADFARTRNYKFLQKFMVLVKLGFKYYTPTGGTITPEEQEIVNRFAAFLCRTAGASSGAIMEEVAGIFLESEGGHRAKGVALIKDFNEFREWVTIEAGHFTEYRTPSGYIIRRAKSISFARMDEIEFDGVYKSVLNVLWNWILFRQFKSLEEAENTAAQLMGFAS
jgi:hypothetical protein